MKIKNVIAREILDSRGNPTLETEIFLANGIHASASVPSGASTGKYEALELRDNNLDRYNGLGVLKAIENVNLKIKKILENKDWKNQNEIDDALIKLDGTKNKSNLGANAILSVSMSFCRATSKSKNLELFEHIGQIYDNNKFSIPNPLALLIEGGKHGNWSSDIQEYSILPTRIFPNFKSKLEAIIKIFNELLALLNEKKYSTGVGFEGAFCPQELKSNEDAFKIILKAIEKASFKPKIDFNLGIDVASSELFKNGNYILKSEKNKKLKPEEWLAKLIEWGNKYPLYLFEDVFGEDEWESWTKLTKIMGDQKIIVGDDLTVTNVKIIAKAISKKAINSVLIKLNQIGTVSETLEAVKIAKKAKLKTIVSHRSAETNDSFIADFAVGVNSDMVKFGAPNRGERIAKYNRLLKIEEILNKKLN